MLSREQHCCLRPGKFEPLQMPHYRLKSLTALSSAGNTAMEFAVVDAQLSQYLKRRLYGSQLLLDLREFRSTANGRSIRSQAAKPRCNLNEAAESVKCKSGRRRDATPIC